MDAHDDTTDTALAHAVADELRHATEVSAPLTVTDLVLRCDEAGVSAVDVLRQALDRVMDQTGEWSSI